MSEFLNLECVFMLSSLVPFFSQTFLVDTLKENKMTKNRNRNFCKQFGTSSKKYVKTRGFSPRSTLGLSWEVEYDVFEKNVSDKHIHRCYAITYHYWPIPRPILTKFSEQSLYIPLSKLCPACWNEDCSRALPMRLSIYKFRSEVQQRSKQICMMK